MGRSEKQVISLPKFPETSFFGELTVKSGADSLPRTRDCIHTPFPSMPGHTAWSAKISTGSWVKWGLQTPRYGVLRETASSRQ